MRFHFSLLGLLNSETKLKMIKFLLGHEASMSEREIASILKISHMSVNRNMRELADIHLVNFVTVGRAHLWRVNRNSYAFKALSAFVKGASAVKIPLEDLKKTLRSNLPRHLAKKVVLFGSISKNAEGASSDIDIFILTRDRNSKEKLERHLDRLSNLCFEIYGNRLAPYILTENEMKQRKNSEIISEIQRGIQIFPGLKGKAHGT